MNKQYKQIDMQVKKALKMDKELITFFTKHLGNDEKASVLFITKCLKKTMTRRMMLRTHWYAKLSDKMDSVEPGRPALSLVFLLALAEGVEKLAQNKDKQDSQSRMFVFKFFGYISKVDKDILARKFKRALLGVKTQTLRYRSILKILWHVRCNAAHGREYWHFTLPDEGRLKEDGWSLITAGELGKPNRKRRVTLDTKLSYEELRDIVIRIAINRIESCFK